MKTADVRAFRDLVVGIRQQADTEIEAIFTEICQQSNWPADAQILVSNDSYSVWWIEDNSVVGHQLGKMTGRLLIEMGFPSGS